MSNLSPYDLSLFVFLLASTVCHRRVSVVRREHAGIFQALVAVVIADVVAMALYPNRGFIPVVATLAVPGACLYGVTSAHGFRCGGAIVLIAGTATASWFVGSVYPDWYAWSVFFAWCIFAATAWACLVNFTTRPPGITRVSAVALAASLLADLPGVYAWARTGSWKAESVLTSTSVAILATLPLLWNLQTSAQSSQDSHCSRSGSGSADEHAPIQMRCE